jgi:hypothetical protein
VPERNIEFDMSGEKRSINDEYLERLEAHEIKYETVLRYLHLPLVSSRRKPSSSSQDPPPGIPDQTGYSDAYASVFKWLKDKDVRKIFRVRVDDIGQKPHGDSIIQSALTGIEIDRLDWRKMDIGSDTIVKAAPAIKALNLYWSGSNAVLQGWACEEGLCQLVNVSEVL